MNAVALDAACLTVIAATCLAFFRLLRNHELPHATPERQPVPDVPFRPTRRRR